MGFEPLSLHSFAQVHGGNNKLCSHDYVRDERSAVPGCVQLPFLCSGEHDGNNHVSLVPLHGRRRQIQECCAHFRLGDLHCGIPLHPHLQLLGCRIPLCCRNGCGWCLGDGQPHLDWYPTQRCLSLHGLALDRALALDRDPSRDEARREIIQREGLEPWCWLCPHDCLRLLWRACCLRRLDPTLDVLGHFHGVLLVHRE